MFFTEGDLNWRHNVSGFSMLNPLVGLLFAIFILSSPIIFLKEKIWKIKNLKNKLWEYFKYIFLIIWFSAMLGPEILSAEGIPHGLRAIGAIPAVFFFPHKFLYLLCGIVNFAAGICRGDNLHAVSGIGLLLRWRQKKVCFDVSQPLGP